MRTLVYKLGRWAIFLLFLFVVAAIYLWYRSYTYRAEGAVRLEAMKALWEVASYQERHRWRERHFSQSLIPLGFDTDPLVTTSGDWEVSIDPGADKDGYVARAVYVGTDDSELRSRCLWLTISAKNERESGPYPYCWPRRRR